MAVSHTQLSKLSCAIERYNKIVREATGYIKSYRKPKVEVFIDAPHDGRGFNSPLEGLLSDQIHNNLELFLRAAIDDLRNTIYQEAEQCNIPPDELDLIEMPPETEDSPTQKNSG